jgi:hypothetical protein
MCQWLVDPIDNCDLIPAFVGVENDLFLLSFICLSWLAGGGNIVLFTLLIIEIIIITPEIKLWLALKRRED